MRALRSIPSLAVVGALALALSAPVAHADTYCVNESGCDHPNGSNLQGALDQAAAHVGPDTVRLGAAPLARAGGFSYSSADPVHIEGSGGRRLGTAGTLLDGSSGAPTDETVLKVVAAGSTISGLSVRIPNGSRNVGIETNAAMSNLLVFAMSASDFPVGAVLDSGAVLARSDVLLSPASGIAVQLAGAGTTVADSRLEGSTGYETKPAIGADASGAVRRTRIEFGGAGLFVREGKIALEDSLLVGRVDNDFSSHTGVWMISFAPGTSVTANHVTVVGSSSAGSTAFSVETAGPATDNSASVVFRNGIVAGFPVTFARNGPFGTASISTDYSNHSGTTSMDSGMGSIVETHRVMGAPLFVDSPAYRLREDSPLIDAGDPAGLAAGESATDLVGEPRIIDGRNSGFCVRRRDLGAYEYSPGPRPPRTSALALPRTARIGEKITFTAIGTCDPDGGTLDIFWQFDDEPYPPGTPGITVQRSFAKPGTHVAKVTARDATGRTAVDAVPVRITLPPYAGVRIPKQTRRSSRSGRVKVRVRCPAGTAGACAGTLRLAGRAAALKIGRGALKRVTVKLSKARLAALRKAKRQKVSARATTHDANGTQKTTTGKVTLLAPR